MKIIPIKTRIFNVKKDDIFSLLDDSLPILQEGDVIAITSKVLAIHQGRIVPISEVVNKDELIKSEAEKYIPRPAGAKHSVVLTLKEYTIIPSAGIDESNADGHYILWPENVYELLQEIHSYLTKKFNIQNLGIISTDSKTVPLRTGVVGVSVGFWGFHPLKDYRGSKDLFGRVLQMSQTNLVDGLAATAVLAMGEGDEAIPLVVLRDVGHISFTNEDVRHELLIEPIEDLYYPLLKAFDEEKNGQ